MTKYDLSIRQRYQRAWKFFKPVVFRDNGGNWIVCGAGFLVLGDVYPTWQEAVAHALSGQR